MVVAPGAGKVAQGSGVARDCSNEQRSRRAGGGAGASRLASSRGVRNCWSSCMLSRCLSAFGRQVVPHSWQASSALGGDGRRCWGAPTPGALGGPRSVGSGATACKRQDQPPKQHQDRTAPTRPAPSPPPPPPLKNDGVRRFKPIPTRVRFRDYHNIYCTSRIHVCWHVTNCNTMRGLVELASYAYERGSRAPSLYTIYSYLL
jgi:hypothetical protein